MLIIKSGGVPVAVLLNPEHPIIGKEAVIDMIKGVYPEEKITLKVVGGKK